MKWGKSLSVVFLIIFLVAFAGNARGETAFLNVEWKNGLLSVHAKNIPLNIILEEVSRKTGIRIYGPTNLLEEKTIRLSNLPIKSVLHELLKPAIYYRISVTDASEGSPSYFLFSRNTGLDNNIIINTLMRTFTNTAIHLSASEEESSSFLVLLNDNADLNKQIIHALISNFTDTQGGGALKRETGSGSVNQMADASQKMTAGSLGPAEEKTEPSEEEENPELIKEQLHHPEPATRAAALESLAYNIDSGLGLEAAKAAVKDSDAQVRSIAEEIIRLFKEDEAEQQEGGE